MRWYQQQRQAERQAAARLHRVAATVHFGPEGEETHFVTPVTSLAELERDVRAQFGLPARARITVHLNARSKRVMTAKAFAAAIARRTGWAQCTELYVRVAVLTRSEE